MTVNYEYKSSRCMTFFLQVISQLCELPVYNILCICNTTQTLRLTQTYV